MSNDRVGDELLARDRHVRRDGDDYGVEFLTFLPQGQAWPREPGSNLVKGCNGLADTWGFVDGRAADLLEIESDPRLTHDIDPSYGPYRGLLSDWERAWGLPDPCFPPTPSEEDRRRMLVFKMTLLGGQSREFFERMSAWVGHEIHISEWSPFTCGISECGDTRYEYDQTGLYRWYIGAPENRYYWFVDADTAVLEWFRCGTPYSECGVHHHLEIMTESPIDCLLQRWKPAHTRMAFNYDFEGGDPYAGTP